MSCQFTSVFIFKHNWPDLSLPVLLLSHLIIALVLVSSFQYLQTILRSPVCIVSLAFFLPNLSPLLSLFSVKRSAHLQNTCSHRAPQITLYLGCKNAKQVKGELSIWICKDEHRHLLGWLIKCLWKSLHLCVGVFRHLNILKKKKKVAQSVRS